MMQYHGSTPMRSSLKYSHLYKTYIGLLLYKSSRAITNDPDDVAYTTSHTWGGVCVGYR